MVNYYDYYYYFYQYCLLSSVTSFQCIVYILIHTCTSFSLNVIKVFKPQGASTTGGTVALLSTGGEAEKVLHLVFCVLSSISFHLEQCFHKF